MMDAGKAASARLHEIAVEIIRLKLCPGGMQSFFGLAFELDELADRVAQMEEAARPLT
jgi:hypothetical protein